MNDLLDGMGKIIWYLKIKKVFFSQAFCEVILCFEVTDALSCPLYHQ